jgi:hypothetical protein
MPFMILDANPARRGIVLPDIFAGAVGNLGHGFGSGAGGI